MWRRAASYRAISKPIIILEKNLVCISQAFEDYEEGAIGSVRDGRGGGDPEATPEPEGRAGNHRGKHRRHSHQEHHGQSHHHTVHQPHAQLHLEGPEHRARNRPPE